MMPDPAASELGGVMVCLGCHEESTRPPEARRSAPTLQFLHRTQRDPTAGVRRSIFSRAKRVPWT